MKSSPPELQSLEIGIKTKRKNDIMDIQLLSFATAPPREIKLSKLVDY